MPLTSTVGDAGNVAIRARDLSKHFGSTAAVRGCSFDVRFGEVTGFLGPNGAGKTTTLKLIVGLLKPSQGSVLVAGLPFTAHRRPAAVLGSMFEQAGFYPGCSARSHARIVADAVGVTRRRVEEVLDMVGLSAVARRPVRALSLGMRQRLSLGVALLADPLILLLDEPTNGLDPEGIAWFRTFAHSQAARGRAVFIASHLLAEMEQSIDHVVVVAEGQIRADCPLPEFIASGAVSTEVRTDRPEVLAAALRSRGHDVHQDPATPGLLVVAGRAADEVGQIASTAGTTVLALGVHEPSLEAIYLAHTSGASLPMTTSHPDPQGPPVGSVGSTERR